ncbi:glycerate kinase [Vibrio sp.]|uniref:glycerate kinase n=1 Tax=Vibrio sp. TaxID=678 RepID=UPI003D11010B
MKIVIAPDSFKETLAASEVALAIETGFRQVFPDWQYIRCPMADGGEGSLASLIAATNGRKVNLEVIGPLGSTIASHYGISGDGATAYIEMAAASGIELIAPSQRNPLLTTSYGTGQLILHALEQGIRRMIICIGGSANNDGGVGMMQALGVSFRDRQGAELAFGGQSLAQLASIDISAIDSRLSQCEIEVACDVSNPLTGPEGASAVYGPQKGASAEMVAALDGALANYARVISQDLNLQVSGLPGAGAAGGMGAAFYAFTNATFRAGIEIITEALELEPLIAASDLVITGEGQLDSQSVNGKVPVGVARLAARYHKPVIALAGALGDDIEPAYQAGIDAAFASVYKITTLDEVITSASENVTRTARNVAATLKIGRTINIQRDAEVE